ncbi:MAG: hypothetical protein J0M25_00705 [Flavobacteriales bacterium]|nr:hypothetical protein [Flavobacteriales bacterium]
MKIKSWFDRSGSFAEGVELYAQLPQPSIHLLKLFKVENTSNFIRLKYELKLAINKGLDKIEIPKNPEIPENSQPKTNTEEDSAFLNQLIESSSKAEFSKETMAMYPPELHKVYRKRISNFYEACELKFKLNALPEEANDQALKIILQLESLWDKIDKAWEILHHWRDHHRIMPTDVSEDYSKFTPMQLANEKGLLETRISKRKKTLEGISKKMDADPVNRVLANSYHKKKEELEQLQVNLETIKKILKGN